MAVILLTAVHALAHAQTVTATWDANTDPYTAGYRLYYGTAPGSYTTSIDVGNVVSRQVTLSPGATYYFVVRAYNAESQLGPASAETSLTMAAPPPTALITATLGANNVATVSWQTTNAATARINGQTVALSGTAQYPVTATTTFQLVATGSGGTASSSATVTVPVVNCVTSSWTFQSATAWGACTNGQQSRTETWTRTVLTQPSGGGAACGPLQEQRVVTQACTVPAPTAQISATLGANNVATLTWQTTNATAATINGQAVALSGTTQYPVSATTTFQLVASGAGGTATASATVTVAVPAPTAQITATLGANNVATLAWQTTNATAATINGQAVALSGTAQLTVTASTTYRLVATGAGGTANASATVTIPVVDCVVSAWQFSSATEWGACTGGQRTRTETWTRSIITQPSGGGAACGALEEQRVVAEPCSDPTPVAPGAPSNPKARVGGNAVTLSWEVPVTGGAPTGYRVWVGTRRGGSNILDGGNVGNVLTAQGQLPRGTYYARMAAYNAVGQGSFSAEISFNVGAKLRPGRPVGFTASLENGVVVLAWQEPVGDDGANAPTTYVVEAGSGPGRSDLARVVVGRNTAYQARVPAGVYYVRVRAANDVGPSDPSEELVLRNVSQVGTPTGLRADGTGTTVALSWQPPSTGDLPAGYVIEAGSAPGLANLAVMRVGAVSAFTTTAPRGTYFIRVRAVAADGTAGPASGEIIVTR